MQLATTYECRAFAVWIRTGRWLQPEAFGDPARKFNPNHDPVDGRFTWGSLFGVGGPQRDPASTIMQGYGGGGAGGTWTRDGQARRASETLGGSAQPSGRRAAPETGPVDVLRVPGPAQGSPQKPTELPRLRHVVRNGYDFSIDAQDRTRTVSGTLTLSPNQPRSRRAQREAGTPSRLPTDDGGHYIAPRFNGPTEAFNHFAQNSNINRGRYRALEDQWAKAKRTGKHVAIRITPVFPTLSLRPSLLDIWFSIDGREESVKLPNNPGGSRHGK